MARLPTPIQELKHSLLEEKNVRLFVKRDDLIHEEIMGNKWRKLHYNIKEARKLMKNTLLTFGGAFSNHIHATAAAGKEFGFKTIGIIRGEELNATSNETLKFATARGMELIFVSREEFRKYRGDPSTFAKDRDLYVLPEGGTNSLAIKGVKELVSEIDIDFNVIATPIGTGGTFCGLMNGVNKQQTVLGISCLRGDFIRNEIKELVDSNGIQHLNYQIETDYHFGGYAKITPELIDFINWFKEAFQISLDPIYTGKCFFAVWNMIKTDKFEKNLRIVLLHTGGLQGISGFNRKMEIIIQ